MNRFSSSTICERQSVSVKQKAVVRHRSLALVSGLLLAQLLTAACGEEGTIRVNSIRFVGIHAIPASRLKGVLATRESSKLPWGKKRYFDRSKFDADVKRIQ